MKEEFLALVEKVKATGIADALCEAATVDERHAVWEKFQEENQELCVELGSWGEEFDGDEAPLFYRNESIQNPLEIAICIYMSDVYEDDIFEDLIDLQFEIRNLGNEYATDFADAMNDDYIVYIDIADPMKKDED